MRAQTVVPILVALVILLTAAVAFGPYALNLIPGGTSASPIAAEFGTREHCRCERWDLVPRSVEPGPVRTQAVNL